MTVLVLALSCRIISTFGDACAQLSAFEQLRGEWHLVRVDGKTPTQIAEAADMIWWRWKFTVGRMSVYNRNRLDSEWALKINVRKTPHVYRLEYLGDNLQIRETYRLPSFGIYKFDGDKLVRCFGPPGSSAPTEFKADIQKSVRLLEFSKEVQ